MHCRNRTARAKWTSGLTVLVISGLITVPITYLIWVICCVDHVIDQFPSTTSSFYWEHPNLAMLLSFNLTIGLFGFGIPVASFLLWELWTHRRTLRQWKAMRLASISEG
jgi:TM2 domain-containing membrane protein YozV